MYYLSSENIGADQLCGYREADLRLCFCLCRLLVFPCADPENFLRGGGGVQIPRRGLTQNCNMAKIKNLAIPGGSGPPVPPPSGSAHVSHGVAYIFVSYISTTDNHVILLPYKPINDR